MKYLLFEIAFKSRTFNNNWEEIFQKSLIQFSKIKHLD